MAIQEIQARSILQKSGLPGAAYVINPYAGCVHGCVYCYARFMKRFSRHEQPWGAYLDAKVNAPARLAEELKRRKEPLSGEVFMSSVTDPYLPAEKRYRLTRGVLEVLLEHGAPVSLLTKSDLVLRDLDLLTRFSQARVGLSLMTVDDELAHRMEPNAPAPSRRIAALRALRAAGVYTYAFISPFLPGLSDLETLLVSLDGAVDEIGVEAINPRHGNWTGVAAVLAEHYPAVLPTCQRLSRDDGYWAGLEESARQGAAQRGLAFMGFFRH